MVSLNICKHSRLVGVLPRMLHSPRAVESEHIIALRLSCIHEIDHCIRAVQHPLHDSNQFVSVC